MISIAPGVYLESGLLPRRYHNAPVTVFGFEDEETLTLILGGYIAQTAGTNSEYYTITNMGDARMQPDLVVKIVDDYMHMVEVGGSGEPISEYRLAYGATATFSKTSNEANCIYVRSDVPSKGDGTRQAVLPLVKPDPWDVFRHTAVSGSTVDVFPSALNIILASEPGIPANLPINSEAGTPIIITNYYTSPTLSVIGGSSTVDGQESIDLEPGKSAYLVYDGVSDWIKVN